VVVPLYDKLLPRGLLSALLHDDICEEEKFFFVCGSDWSLESRLHLNDLINFYGVKAETMAVDFTVAPVLTLLKAVREIGASKTIVVSSQVSELDRQTRDRFYNELNESDFVCPTVLFEDGSVRYAGATKVAGLRRSPFLRVRSASGGLPLGQTSPVMMTGGSLACCGFRLDAVERLCKESAYLTRSFGETALFMKAHSLGLHGKWDGSTVIVAPDAGVDESAIRQMLDCWMIRKEVEASQCAC
jgi:hypothetical protein